MAMKKMAEMKARVKTAEREAGMLGMALADIAEDLHGEAQAAQPVEVGGIADHAPLAPAAHQAGLLEDREVRRERVVAHPQPGGDLARRQPRLSRLDQQAEGVQPGGLAQGRECGERVGSVHMSGDIEMMPPPQAPPSPRRRAATCRARRRVGRLARG